MKRRLFLLVPFATVVILMIGANNAGRSQNATHPAATSKLSRPVPKGRWYSTRWGQSFRPDDGYVPDQKTAVEVAKAIPIPIYGEGQMKSEEPFSVSLEDNVWRVKGSVPHGPGGNVEVKLSKTDGAVLYVTHTQ
jgi:hypothetical protein